jgi:hypothetical protein
VLAGRSAWSVYLDFNEGNRMFNGGFVSFIWSLFLIYIFVMVLFMFVRVFMDIFSRENLSGWGKAGWMLLLVFFPFIGIIIYVIVRPKNTDQDQRMMADAKTVQARLVGGSAVDDIAKAQDLLDKGSITQDEFNVLKAKALA